MSVVRLQGDEYAFVTDLDQLVTYYRRDVGPKMQLMLGVLVVQHRLESKATQHVTLPDDRSGGADQQPGLASPYKGATESERQTVAFVFKWQWKVDGKTHQRFVWTA